MASNRAQTFIDALAAAEASRDPSGLVRLFAPQARLANLGAADQSHPNGDPMAFWRRYLDTFSQVRSEFTTVTESADASILEWRARGALRGGTPIDYRGVSIVEWDGDQVGQFRTYYDSAAFVSAAK